MNIGNKVKKLREDKNYSREQMADFLKMSPQTYAKIETNERKATVEEIELIAVKLEIDPIDLIYNEPKMIFENCQQNGMLGINNGNITFAEVNKIKDEQISNLKKQIEDLQKDKKSQQNQIEILNALLLKKKE